MKNIIGHFGSKLFFYLIIIFSLVIFQERDFFGQQISNSEKQQKKGKSMTDKIQKKEKEWKEILTPEQYNVLREKGTERPFTGKYWNYNEKGVYKCAACGQILFESDSKYDAGCGWPSFNEVINSKNVIAKDDYNFNMHRIEVICSNCGGHLGHLFDDGPKPSSQRYCINSASLIFEKTEK